MASVLLIPVILTFVFFGAIVLAFRHGEVGAVFSTSFLAAMIIGSGLVEAGIL